jgi:drug/metabolite transporter (DMT)-like permease
LQVTFVGALAALAACLPFSPQLVRGLPAASMEAIAAIVYLGLVVNALSFLTWGYALARARAGQTAAATYLVPPLAILIGWALLGERPAALAVVGGLVAIAGVIVARR